MLWGFFSLFNMKVKMVFFLWSHIYTKSWPRMSSKFLTSNKTTSEKDTSYLSKLHPKFKGYFLIHRSLFKMHFLTISLLRTPFPSTILRFMIGDIHNTQSEMSIIMESKSLIRAVTIHSAPFFRFQGNISYTKHAFLWACS